MSRYPSLLRLEGAILIASLAITSVAWAGAQEEADELARQGIELRRRGDDARSLPLFQKAHRIAPTPRSAVQLGTAEQALGRWAEAEEHLAQGLRSPEDPWIKKNRAVIDEALRTVKGHIGSLEVTGTPVGAEVRVNGRPVGNLPLAGAVRVNAGEVDVEVNASGHRRGFRTVKVTAGDYHTVVLRLEAMEGPPPPPPPAPTAPRPWQRWAAYGALGGGAVAAGVGTFGLLRFNDKVGTFNDGCLEGPQVPVSKSTHQPDNGCAQLQADYENARTLSIVGFSVAGALVATGVILLLTAPDSAGGEEKVAWACGPDVGRVGVTCSGRF